MRNETESLVNALREHAEWAQANEWETPITLSDDLTEAADMIEQLSAELQSDERQYGRDAFAILADEGAKLEAERNAWKKKADALERELRGLCWCCANAKNAELGTGHRHALYACGEMRKRGVIAGSGWCVKCEHWKWRGPCAENGGDPK